MEQKVKTYDLLGTIIRPTLNRFPGMGGENAEWLMLVTAVAESNLQYIQQVRGPAVGMWQVEPATHHDIWVNYLRYRDQEDLRGEIHDLFIVPGLFTPGFEFTVPQTRAASVAHAYLPLLKFDQRYNCLMARLVYRRDPHPIPSRHDFDAVWEYYKRVFNTRLGKARKDRFRAKLKAHELIR
jgi:hypothetical protein